VKVGSYYWVRFKRGSEREWRPGQVRKNSGLLWVAQPYDKSHFGVDHFEFGPEIRPPQIGAIEAARRILAMDPRPRRGADSWVFRAWWRVAYYGPYQLNWWLKRRCFGKVEGVHDRELLWALVGGRMRRWLVMLPHATLMRIAHDLGFEGQFRGDAVDFVMEQAKTYRWKIGDLESRYQLRGDE